MAPAVLRYAPYRWGSESSPKWSIVSCRILESGRLDLRYNKKREATPGASRPVCARVAAGE